MRVRYDVVILAALGLWTLKQLLGELWDRWAVQRIARGTWGSLFTRDP